jgi:hypothetical protein
MNFTTYTITGLSSIYPSNSSTTSNTGKRKNTLDRFLEDASNDDRKKTKFLDFNPNIPIPNSWPISIEIFDPNILTTKKSPKAAVFMPSQESKWEDNSNELSITTPLKSTKKPTLTAVHVYATNALYKLLNGSTLKNLTALTTTLTGNSPISTTVYENDGNSKKVSIKQFKPIYNELSTLLNHPDSTYKELLELKEGKSILNLLDIYIFQIKTQATAENLILSLENLEKIIAVVPEDHFTRLLEYNSAIAEMTTFHQLAFFLQTVDLDTSYTNSSEQFRQNNTIEEFKDQIKNTVQNIFKLAFERPTSNGGPLIFQEEYGANTDTIIGSVMDMLLDNHESIQNTYTLRLDIFKDICEGIGVKKMASDHSTASTEHAYSSHGSFKIDKFKMGHYLTIL